MKPLAGAPLSSLIALVKNRTRDANEFLAASIAIGPIILIGSLPPGAQLTIGAHVAAEGSISGAGGIFSHFGVIGYRWNSARGSVRRYLDLKKRCKRGLFVAACSSRFLFTVQPAGLKVRAAK